MMETDVENRFLTFKLKKKLKKFSFYSRTLTKQDRFGYRDKLMTLSKYD